MAKRKTRAELESELRFVRRHQIGDNVASVLNNLIRWGGLVGIAAFFYLSIRALSGAITLADIGIIIETPIGADNIVEIIDQRLSYPLQIIVVVGAVLYGLRQRRLRKDTIERLQGRIRELEEHIDPHRSSSGLTTRGDTAQEDRK